MALYYKCTKPGCTSYKDFQGPCVACKKRQRKASDARRGTSTERGYGKAHREARDVVLARDPFCSCANLKTCRYHVGGECVQRSVVADHYPLSVKQLEKKKIDPNNPDRMRGLCKPCHDIHTGQRQGWMQKYGSGGVYPK